jgi:hypothetical protein
MKKTKKKKSKIKVGDLKTRKDVKAGATAIEPPPHPIPPPPHP